MITRHIGEFWEINWEVLHEVGFAKEVKHLLSAGVRRQLFSITDTTYRELMMEVFASFELERGMVSFNKASTI